MPPVPVVPGQAVVKALERLGFEVVRITGSHYRLAHADGCVTSVPVHRGHDLPRGTLRGIMADLCTAHSDGLLRLL
jgi:predicted RNA binding protein YcfA (HicA-like mRNA interferase family)